MQFKLILLKGQLCIKLCTCVLSCSVVSDSFVTPMNCSLPCSSVHGICRQEYWSGLPFPIPGI